MGGRWPDAMTQATIILDRLRERPEVDVPDDLEPEDIVEWIDDTKPPPVNQRRVAIRRFEAGK